MARANLERKLLDFALADKDDEQSTLPEPPRTLWDEKRKKKGRKK